MTHPDFSRLIEIVAALRDPQTGCPWDLEQDHRSLRPYLIEEAYELIEAINENDDGAMMEELGDVLLQVAIHSQLAAERKAFGINEVCQRVADKMISRHPHVFGDVTAETSAEVLKNWELIKQREKAERKQSMTASLLDGLPASLPSLQKAQRIGAKVGRVNFDWDSLSGVVAKVREEYGEFFAEFDKVGIDPAQALIPTSEQLAPALKSRLESELGDLLFSLAQLARWLGIEAEGVLQEANQRFRARMEAVEKLAGTRALGDLSPVEWAELWSKVKAVGL